MPAVREVAKRAVKRNAEFIDKVIKEQKGLLLLMKSNIKKQR